MEDNELRKLLQETCSALPGQEARAWSALRARLAPPQGPLAWLFVPSRGGLVFALVITVALFVAGEFFGIGVKPISLATANSQSPGVYATSFYSDSAKAQVVWLNGMAPATDKPTYLDPTTEIPAGNSSAPGQDPNSL